MDEPNSMIPFEYRRARGAAICARVGLGPLGLFALSSALWGGRKGHRGRLTSPTLHGVVDAQPRER